MNRAIIVSLLAGAVIGCAPPAAVVPPPVASCDCHKTLDIQALDASGKPVPNVQIYDGSRDPFGDVNFNDSVATGTDGIIRMKDPGYLFGVAPDGRTAYTDGSKLKFGPVATLTIRLTDGSGKPVAGRNIWLSPAIEPVAASRSGSIGEMDNVGTRPPSLQGNTDTTGAVRFPNLPVGIPFFAFTSISAERYFRFTGTVLAGSAVTDVLSDRCSVSGHFYTATGRPIAGATVKIQHAAYIVGILDNAPDDIAIATTDRKGAYSISGLPNAALEIAAVPSGSVDTPEVTLRKPGGRWQPNDGIKLVPGRSVCDIRILRK